MAKAKANVKTISNRRARHDYDLGDSLVVGIELTGAETKNLRMGHGHLRGSYVTIRGTDLALVNATIAGSAGIPIDETEQTRDRRLLAKRREIDALIKAKQQGRTIVPLEITTRSRYIKLKIAVGKGKKHYDKRQSLKAKDQNRQINRELNRHH